MKLNWGAGIALFYGLFVVVLVSVVIKTTTYDHSLVSEHYYADDIKYQEHYDKLVNAQLLETDLLIKPNDPQEAVYLKFPDQAGAIRGEIHFFCPSDSDLDFRVPVQPDDNREQMVSTKGLKPGLWRVKVDWKAGEKAFYKEEVLTL